MENVTIKFCHKQNKTFFVAILTFGKLANIL